MLTDDQVAAAARDLFEAERSGAQMGLLSARHPAMDMDDAYRVQAALTESRRAAGHREIGWKIGLTSKAMQRQLNIDIPDSGVLFDDMLFENGAAIPKGRFIQPRVEAEIAFVMKAPISGAATREEVLAATEAVAPSLEILDTRIIRADPASGKARTIVDTIADNAANAGLVLGAARHAPDAVDLRWAGAILKRDGVVEETGLGAAVLDDPAMGVAWLAQRLSEQGLSIRAGDVVLSGSFVRAVEAPGGSEFHADFGPFGQVSCRFE